MLPAADMYVPICWNSSARKIGGYVAVMFAVFETSVKNWELLRNVTSKLCVIGHLFMPGISKSRVSPDC